MSSGFYFLCMDEEIKKTSVEWYHSQNEYKLLDPDGWDRNNFHYSWYEEEITREEFNKRMMSSTIEGKIKG